MPNLSPLLPHLPLWTLVLFRISGIFIMAPLFGSQLIPGRMKVLLAVGLSLCVYPILAGGAVSAQTLQAFSGTGVTLPALVVAVAMELTIGFVIGYGASLPVMGMQVGGKLISQQMGLGLAEVFNPDDQGSGIVSEIYFIVAMMIFVTMGGHRLLLSTLIGSFQSVPLGGFTPDGRTLELVIGLLASMFELALRVSGPLLCLIFLETVAMGFIARTVPQMNILSIGFAIRILIGTALLIGGLAIEASVFAGAMRETLRKLALFFG